MAALTYAAVLERLHGDAGALLKATSEPLSDGLSTQHSCFRRTRGSGGTSRPFHLHMVFLRSHRPECCHFTSICNTSPLISSFLAQAQLFPRSADTPSLPSFHPSSTHTEAGRRLRASQSDHNDSVVVNSQSPSCVLFFVFINRPTQFGDMIPCGC